MLRTTLLLLLDNHDSFTFNLAQYLGELGASVKVVFSDGIGVPEVLALAPERIVLSPGPGRPSDAGVSIELVRALGGRIPLLGVCLGHQAIAEAYGGRVVRAPQPVHGKVHSVTHDGRGLFDGLASPIRVTRYHSLVVDPARVPDELEVCARAEVDGVIMALRHRRLPVHGLQFHPESIGTPDGHALLRAFLST